MNLLHNVLARSPPRYHTALFYASITQHIDLSERLDERGLIYRGLVWLQCFIPTKYKHPRVYLFNRFSVFKQLIRCAVAWLKPTAAPGL